MHVERVIDECTDIVRRWTEQERGRSTDPVIKDRDINASIRKLLLAAELATPLQVIEINRFVTDTETLLNSATGGDSGRSTGSR